MKIELTGRAGQIVSTEVVPVFPQKIRIMLIIPSGRIFYRWVVVDSYERVFDILLTRYCQL